MLGIVLELGDVASTVRCLQQVRLCAASKWTQVLDGGDASIHKHLLGFGWVSGGIGVEAVNGSSQQLPQLLVPPTHTPDIASAIKKQNLILSDLNKRLGKGLRQELQN
jgi:hypothetical protein